MHPACLCQRHGLSLGGKLLHRQAVTPRRWTDSLDVWMIPRIAHRYAASPLPMMTARVYLQRDSMQKIMMNWYHFYCPAVLVSRLKINWIFLSLWMLWREIMRPR